MSKITFVVATGHNMNIEALTLPDHELPIGMDFNKEIPTIGMARLFKEDGKIKAEAEIPDQYLSFFPYLGVRDVPLGDGEQGYTTAGNVCEICIGSGENQDPAIRPIADQIKPQVSGGQS